jgi:hypothetical protein
MESFIFPSNLVRLFAPQLHFFRSLQLPSTHHRDGVHYMSLATKEPHDDDPNSDDIWNNGGWGHIASSKLFKKKHKSKKQATLNNSELDSPNPTL